MDVARYLVDYLIFPGFLFTAVVGLLTTWVDRKVTARIHWRVGPPWYQPFADTVKLLGKEVIVPAGARKTGFLLMPIVGLAAATLASTILWKANLDPGNSFIGDSIVVLYIMTIPAIAMITVMPEPITARPEVAAATFSASLLVRPASRSSPGMCSAYIWV